MFEKIVEERIKKAMEMGEFDDLQGKGKPLRFEDDTFVPEDLRVAYKILKNAGFLPPELYAEKDIKNAMDLLEGLSDEKKRYRQSQKLNLLITKANLTRKRPVSLEKKQIYYDKIVERLSTKKKK
jgi:hypothetical protein